MRSMPEPCRNECGDWEEYWTHPDLGGEDWEKSRPMIDYRQVKFSDGLVLDIPYEIDEKIHLCPTIDFYEPFFNPGKADTDFGPPDDHFDSLFDCWEEICDICGQGPWDDSLQIFTKEDRAAVRRTLVNVLNRYFIPYSELLLPPLMKIISKVNFPWIKDSQDVEDIYPLQLLALFYHMDDLWSDAKKCLEILLKPTSKTPYTLVGTSTDDAISKQIEFYSDKITELKNKELPSLPDESKSIFSQIVDDFENGTLEKYIEAIFTREELTRILKETPERWSKTSDGWEPSKTSLLDKSRKFQGKEENKELILKNPKDLDYLDFGDKIAILRKKFYGKKLDNGKWEKNPEQQERDLIKHLKRISGLRNDLGHRGMEKFRKEELSSEIAQVVYLMKWCNKFFKKNPGK